MKNKLIQSYSFIILSWLSITLLSSGFSMAQDNNWTISTRSTENYTAVVLANGRLGILPSHKPFQVQHIILNNVYDRETEHGVSKILKGMNFGNLEIEIDGERITEHNISNWSQSLNMKEAHLSTTFNFGDKASISYKIYALRNVPFAGFIDIQVIALKDIKVKVTGKIETPDEYQNPTSTFRVLKDLESTLPVLQTVAQSRFGRHTVSTSATFIWNNINSVRENERPELTHTKLTEYTNQLIFTKKIKKGSSLDFSWSGSQCSTQDFNDPQSESERFVIYTLLTPREDLLSQHKTMWNELWQGDIIIEGDKESQQDVRLALYHLYAFGRSDSDLSISPMGLSSQAYNGHIFWDAELWMFPPILLLNHEIAESLVNYRYNRLNAAKRKAVNFGFEGAMFPWESDDSGEESTPTWALTGTFEHHISADIAIASWNYFLITQNKEWLREKGFPIIKEVADFWVSHSSKNSDGTYSIQNVIGANEYAHNVTDNAFTNGAAITSLKFARLASEVLETVANPEWTEVASHLLIHRFEDGTTKEHSSYKGEIIKQADVNLLAFPLSIVTEHENILKDLAYYEPKLDKNGPAMSKSILSILYARMGDSGNAYRLFKEGYEPNKRPPFGALSESANSNNPYFATGAGGLLQMVLFGFGGLYITEKGIIQKDPILPKQWKSITIKGVGPEKKTYFVN